MSLPARYRLLPAMTLALAAFNLTFRLGSEFVNEWDESLYAVSAWETLHHGTWLGTTFFGQLDYYNTKPPLMIWLIAASFKAFGVSLWSLRITSAVAAWITVFVMQRWTQRVFGAAVAIATTLVLSTTFGFVHVHSGRDAVTDAASTLAVALTALVLYRSDENPRLLVWLGPVFAAAFMLRGMAVLMPAAIAALVLPIVFRRRLADLRWLIPAFVLFVFPVGAWALARYQLDGWKFLGPLFLYDFVARTVDVIEEHPGGPFFYLNILQKNHYDWLVAAAASLALFPVRWGELRREAATGHGVVLIGWALVALLLPTVMRTKQPWYLNTFYPVFAVGVGLAITRPFTAPTPIAGWRRLALVVVLVLAAGVAEGKLVAYLYRTRDLAKSDQALLLDERERLRGRRVYDEGRTRAVHFVAEAIVGADPRPCDRAGFLNESASGDFLLTSKPSTDARLQLIRSNQSYYLYRRN